MAADGDNTPDRHIPVLLNPVLQVMKPSDGDIIVDGTFGAGGYTRGMLEAAACKVFAIDRDNTAISAGASMIDDYEGRLMLLEGRFSEMEALLQQSGVSSVSGIVLDVGVSSMQLDQAERGFSFMREGPLDMRMDRTGLSAADLVNTADERDLRFIISVLGEEKRAYAVARAIVEHRDDKPFETTLELANTIEQAIGRPPKQGGPSIHPATRTFQALRIYVNAELKELATALGAAERLLQPGGRLAVVTFHSLEDRIVKRFLKQRSGRVSKPSRHMPQAEAELEPSFEDVLRGGVIADEGEIMRNARARSARLRAGVRTHAPVHPFDLESFGREVTLC